MQHVHNLMPGLFDLPGLRALAALHDKASRRLRGTGRRRTGKGFDTVRPEVRAAWDKGQQHRDSRQQRRARQRELAKQFDGARNWRRHLHRAGHVA